jgi:hypothetical protein
MSAMRRQVTAPDDAGADALFAGGGIVTVHETSASASKTPRGARGGMTTYI